MVIPFTDLSVFPKEHIEQFENQLSPNHMLGQTELFRTLNFFCHLNDGAGKRSIFELRPIDFVNNRLKLLVALLLTTNLDLY